MFEYLKNIWDGIKGFFSFFESILTYIKQGFVWLSALIKLPIEIITNFGDYVPGFVLPLTLAAVFTIIISVVLGRERG